MFVSRFLRSSDVVREILLKWSAGLALTMTPRLAENDRSVEVLHKGVVVLKLRSSCVERCSYLHEVAEEEVDRVKVETTLLVLGGL